jgi:hypothetical protein
VQRAQPLDGDAQALQAIAQVRSHAEVDARHGYAAFGPVIAGA